MFSIQLVSDCLPQHPFFFVFVSERCIKFLVFSTLRLNGTHLSTIYCKIFLFFFFGILSRICLRSPCYYTYKVSVLKARTQYFVSEINEQTINHQLCKQNLFFSKFFFFLFRFAVQKII